MITVGMASRGTSRPEETFPRLNHKRCKRCGIVRHTHGGHTRVESGYCGDCLPYAKADGWTHIQRGQNHHLNTETKDT